MPNNNQHQLSSLFGLEGRTAIVTGAGRGIGKEVATLLASVGARVVIADMNYAAANTTAEELKQLGADAIGVAVDVSNAETVKKLFEESAKAFGNVAILVNVAAIFPTEPFLDISVEKWDRVHEVNTRGVFLCMREAIKQMKAEGNGGSIVNISSVNSLHPVIFDNAQYASSKAGVNMLTKTAALEFAGDQIRVNAVLPGGVDTEGARAAQTGDYPAHGPIGQPGRVPLGRIGVPMDIAAAVLFLASPASNYITGQLLAVDGGFTVS
ncbi:SDR family NAD(P)-dependent oxidoreductase [Pseudomonas sp. BF-R-19]|uniref:SDR family NAD(P)-dependent oxidoreductase n=1 Tax=Pseudomonas sp. BF-R-19 TaxID=2832397 RepID=UPI001CBF4D7D|nr:SDR family NAD(P)-dependent oxidoreductase [Pseudomonas sp. BF-R-19]